MRLSGWAEDMINGVETEINYCLTPELMKDLSGKEETSELMAIIEMRIAETTTSVSYKSTPWPVRIRPSAPRPSQERSRLHHSHGRVFFGQLLQRGLRGPRTAL